MSLQYSILLFCWFLFSNIHSVCRFAKYIGTDCVVTFFKKNEKSRKPDPRNKSPKTKWMQYIIVTSRDPGTKTRPSPSLCPQNAGICYTASSGCFEKTHKYRSTNGKELFLIIFIAAVYNIYTRYIDLKDAWLLLDYSWFNLPLLSPILKGEPTFID